MRRPRRILAAAIAVLVLAGCTSQPDPELPGPPENVDLSQVDHDDRERNGIWHLSGADALQQVIRAARNGGGATISGTIVEKVVVAEDAPPVPGRTISINVGGTESNYSASVTAGAVAVEIVMTDGAAYVSGNAAYAVATGVAELAGGFVCVTPGDPLLQAWTPLLTPAALLDAVVASGAATAAVTPPTSAEADTVNIVLDSGGSPLGILTVSAVGAPLPLSFAAGDVSGDGSLSFSWGEAPTVAAPATLARDCG